MQPLDHHSQEGGPLGVRDHDDGDGDGDDGDGEGDGDGDGDGNGDGEEEERSDMDTGDIMMDLDEELSHFIPQVQFEEDNGDSMMNDQTDGPGPTTQANRTLGADPLCTLDDDDDSRVVDVHPSAGYVIGMDETLHNKWRKAFGDLKDLQTVDDVVCR